MNLKGQYSLFEGNGQDKEYIPCQKMRERSEPLGVVEGLSANDERLARLDLFRQLGTVGNILKIEDSLEQQNNLQPALLITEKTITCPEFKDGKSH